MASFTDVTVTGLLSFGLAQGKLLAQGAQLQQPSAEHAALIAGNNNNVVLPNFEGVGAMYFTLTGASGANLTGIETTDKSIEAGQVLVLVNGGSNAITCVANSSASTVGNRFSAVAVIGAGYAALFVYNGTAFVPFLPATS